MNKIKMLTIAGPLLMASSLLTSVEAEATSMTSGIHCEAANLTQALAGIGWSQAGVVNNATTSFFVVCPLDRDLNFGAPARVAVWGIFPGAGTIECTARTQNLQTGGYTSASFTVSSGEGGLGPNRGSHIADLAFDFETSGNGTVVCALSPGEGIELTYPLGPLGPS